MCKCIEGILRGILLVFNFFLLLAGIALVGLGGFVAAEFGKYAREEFFEQRYLFGFVGVAIVIGILLFLVGLCGIGGLCCKNMCMLKAFIVCIIIVIILEIAVMVLVFVYRHEGKKSAEEGIARLLNGTYAPGGSTKTRDLLNELQSEFKCCGGFNISDYTGVPGDVPQACCSIPNCTGVDVTPANYYFQGCGDKLFDEIHSLGIGVFVIAIIVALLQFIGLILACKYMRDEDEGKHV